MAFSELGTVKPRPRRKPVAGPYRSQSSIPKIRAKATRYEHRKVRPTAPPPRPKPKPVRTPVESLRHAEAKLARQSNPKLREATRRLRHALAAEARFKASQPTPEGSGGFPDRSLRSVAPRAYRKSFRTALHAGSSGGATADPAAELALSTAATLGVGAGARLAGLAGKAGVEAIGAKLASKEVSAGEDAAEAAAKRLLARAGRASKAKATAKVKRIRTAPRRAVNNVRTAPERARALPGRARQAATTSEGRRAAAKAAARSSARHPVRTGVPAAAISPVPLPGSLDKRARAAIVGTARAITHHPIETLETTARSLPAAITGPAALIEAAGLSAIHGNPTYLTKTASEQAKGVGKIVGDTFSGNTKKAEEAARKEGSLALATPLPALTRLKAYERARGGLRDVAAKGRRNLAARSETLNRRVRHAPEGVDQHVSGLLERRSFRGRVGKLKSRVDNPFRVSAAKHDRALRHAIAKAPKGSHVALQTLAEYGIRDLKGAEFVRHRGPGDKQLIRALDYAHQHPEIFKSKEFHKALKVLDRASKTAPAAMVGKGERARLLQQGDALDVLRPEERAPAKAVALTGERSRVAAWSALDKTEKQITRLRKSGRERLVQARVLEGARAAKLKEQTRSIYGEARRLEAHVAELRKALDPYTRPGHSIDASTRKPYDAQMLAAYKREVESGRRAVGLAPAIWTHHAEADMARGTGLENRFPTNPGRVEHLREGNLAKVDNLDRSFEGLLSGTIHMPRLRAAGKQFGRDLVREFKTPFKINGERKFVGQGSADWKAITGPKTRENPNGGQFDPQSVARFPLREWKNAIKDPFTTEHDLLGILQSAESGKVKGSEPWVLMPREVIREARAQINPEHNPLTRGMNTFARVSNRAILGTNPAWLVAQTAAEGIPLLLAKPSVLVKGPGLARDIAAYRKAKPEESAYIQATAGASPHSAAAAHTPLDQQETYTPALWEKGAKALTRGKTARAALSMGTFRALGELDRSRQNAYRTVLFAAEADKRFRSFHRSLTELFDTQARLAPHFKTRQELWDWFATDPKGKAEAQKIADYVDNIQGNWTAFTHYERAFAPFTIFYPFLRYSLRFALWTFPKTHPVTATIAYMLGQANSNELEKLLGAKPSSSFAYAFPVYGTPVNPEQVKKLEARGLSPERAKEIAGHAVLPGGSRISPGQSSLTQALSSGNPAQILSSANPFLAAGVTALTGTEPLSGEKASLPKGMAAINQLLAMPAPLRLAGVKLGGRSAASKAYAGFDPYKGARSLAFPFIPQSGERFVGSEKLNQAFAKKYGEGHVPGPFDSKLVQDLLYGGPNSTPQPKKLPEVLAKIHESEVGGAAVKRAEAPFYGKSKPFSPLQKRLLEAVENAWQTGPNGQGSSSNQFGLPVGGSSALMKRFGLESASSSALKQRFGIE